MSRNMSSCQRLACGTGSRMGWITLFYITGSCMSCKCSFAYIGHPKHTSTCPLPARFYSFAWTSIFWVFFLKVW